MIKTALVADNSGFVRYYIKEILRENGIETIVEAEDAREAFEAYKALKPDLVTLDVIMPGGSGLDALKNIREHAPDAKVLIVTDVGKDDTEKKALELGAAAVLRKPLTSPDLKAALARMENPQAPASASAGKARVLVVDDSTMMRAMVRGLLEEQGLQVIGEAADVQEGIKAYADLKPDLVTVDLVMPGGSGMDVLKDIMAKDPQAKVIVVTSVAQADVNQALLSQGAKAVLHKPLTTDSLKAALDKTPFLKPAGETPSKVTAKEIEALKEILNQGAQRCIDALQIMCNKVKWNLSCVELYVESDKKRDSMLTTLAAWDSVSVQMTVDETSAAMTCLFLVPKEGAERMASLLTRNLSAKSLGEDVVKLATLEWANIMITNTINVFSDSLKKAMISSPPEFMEAPILDVVKQASQRICEEADQTVFALSGYSCESLGICCETLFVLRTDSLHKFAPGGKGK